MGNNRKNMTKSSSSKSPSDVTIDHDSERKDDVTLVSTEVRLQRKLADQMKQELQQVEARFEARLDSFAEVIKGIISNEFATIGIHQDQGQEKEVDKGDIHQRSPNTKARFKDQVDKQSRPPVDDNPFTSTKYDPLEYGPGDSSDSQPAILNQIQPETYDGDKTKARSWLRHYETTMKVNGYNDQQKLIRAVAYMKGPASHWYNVTINRVQDLDWYGFTTRFLNHFCGTDGRAQLSEKIDRTKQSVDEHPSQFLMRILDLCLQYNPNMPEHEMMAKVHKGLRADIVNSLVASKLVDHWTIDWLEGRFAAYKMPDKPPPVKPISTRPNRQPRDTSKLLCYNCDNYGHLRKDCPLPRDEAKVNANIERHKKKMESQSQETKPEANVLRLRAEGLISRLHDDTKKPHMTFEVNGLKVRGRVDCGADITAIPSDLAEKLKLKLNTWKNQPLLAVNRSEVHTLGFAPVKIKHGDKKKLLPVVVLPQSYVKQPLWGADLLYALEVSIDFGKPNSYENDIVPKEDTQSIAKLAILEKETVENPINKIQLGELEPEDLSELTKLTLKYTNVFSRNDQDIGHTKTLKHRIILKDDIPITRQPYRIPFRNRDSLKSTLDNLLANGTIRPSKSPYASPVFFVDKDGGKDKRLVADYRALNAKTVDDRMPMPHPEDIFGLLSGMTTFCKLDITSMFNQVEIEEQDVHKTAITTPFGLFEYVLMPFGLKNAPATAVRLMRDVLRNLDNHICYVYFDDIIIFAQSNKQLLDRFRSVLQRLQTHGLKLKPTKCVLCVPTLKFLGHVISAEGVQVDPARIEKVKNFPVPKNASQVRSFHGLASYNRKFIKDFAAIAKPLTPLMGKVEPFIWTDEAQQAFDTLRKALVKPPILVHFDPDARLELRTDASSYALGALLYQISDKAHHTGVLLYWSKTLTPTQRNYSATERELLAVFNAIMELQHYLFGKKFTVVTDHAALSLLRNHRDPHQRIARWVAQLQAYDFEVVHKNGKSHLDADCLSRLVGDNGTNNEEEARFLIRSLSLEEAEAPDVDIDIKEEQRKDAYCSKFIDILQNEALSDEEKAEQAKGFTLQEDILYRVCDDTPLIVIPEKLTQAVLHSCHDLPLAGHLGFARTYGMIKCRYYWPKMRKQVKRYVASCFNCQRRKSSNKIRQGLTKPLPIAEDIFDTVGIDLINKLPKSKSGYVAILVATDNLSKYVVTATLKDETADTIIHAVFTHLIAKHGCPKVIISDRGLNIAGIKAKRFYEAYGIKRYYTSAYHPQSNGQTERFNRTLAASLTTYVEKNQRNWSDYIAAITFAYNITPHSVTNVAPFELIFGRRPRIPLDNILGRNEFIDPLHPSRDIRSTAALQVMKEAIAQSQRVNKSRLDSRLSPCTFTVGDLVLFERPTRVRGQASKLTYTHTGPYKIARKLGDVTFEIVAEPNCTDRRVTRVVHPCSLKLYHPRDITTDDQLPVPTFHPAEAVEMSQPNSVSTQSASEADDDEDIPSPPFEPLTPPRALTQ